MKDYDRRHSNGAEPLYLWAKRIARPCVARRSHVNLTSLFNIQYGTA
jgi:hypothetical protein